MLYLDFRLSIIFSTLIIIFFTVTYRQSIQNLFPLPFKMTNCQMYFVILFVYLTIKDVFSLSDVTNKVFSKVPSGLIAAFGDFDADKYTDVFVISHDGELFIYLSIIHVFSTSHNPCGDLHMLGFL